MEKVLFLLNMKRCKQFKKYYKIIKNIAQIIQVILKVGMKNHNIQSLFLKIQSVN